MAKNTKAFVQDFAFYEQLWEYYSKNRGKIRSRYNDLTKKFLAYNDSNENSDAFLREPQFEALEMYVFVKEFMDNAHMYQMFDEWRKRDNRFSDASYYTIHKGGQGTLLDMGDEQNEIVFKQMKKYKEDYPNYIYALTMGLGKTILMATCIFYEFLLAKKYPKDKRFCHNALVFAPDKTVLESLREIMTFDKTKVVPPEYAHVLDQNIKFHFLEGTGITLHTIDDSDFNIVISNNQKIIVKKKRKEDTPVDILFGSGSLLADVYGGNGDDGFDVWDEGWNCRSLLGIALFRSPKSKVFVLQATMRCLRQLTKEQLKATIFLSKENYDTLDDELRKNYNMEISDFGKSPNTNKKVYKVRVLPPPRSIKMKRLWHEYSLIEKEYSVPIDFHLAELDESKYEAKMYEKGSLRLGLSEKETNIDSMKEQERFSEFSLTAEISRYMNISCLTIAKILRESVDGSDNIVAAVNRHNEILEDVIIPEIFHTLYEVKSTQKSEDVDMVLLREPKDSGYYEFSANDELVITKGHNNFTPKEEAKSFHADTYCFDSKPEKECFLQYISSNKVKEIYFTGMFTSNQGDLSVQYYDPESKRLRKYYPDFLALMEDGSYQLIEVKGDNKIDDEVVLAKKAAAEEMAVASGIHYLMYAGSTLMKSNVLEPTLVVQQASIDI